MRSSAEPRSSTTRIPSWQGFHLLQVPACRIWAARKSELVSADHQGNPQVGQNQTLRLITQEKVAAMLGAYHSSVALVATAVAQGPQGIPFLVLGFGRAEHYWVRSFKWIFRTGPIASDFGSAYTQFLNDLKKAGRPINNIAIVNENTEYGTSVAASINEAAKRAGITVAAQIPYNANSTDVSGQVLQLKQSRGRYRHLHQLYRGYHPLFQDTEEPRLPARAHHRR